MLAALQSLIADLVEQHRISVFGHFRRGAILIVVRHRHERLRWRALIENGRDAVDLARELVRDAALDPRGDADFSVEGAGLVLAAGRVEDGPVIGFAAAVEHQVPDVLPIALEARVVAAGVVEAALEQQPHLGLIAVVVLLLAGGRRHESVMAAS
jgi:hypothetical protein